MRTTICVYLVSFTTFVFLAMKTNTSNREIFLYCLPIEKFPDMLVVHDHIRLLFAFALQASKKSYY